MAAEETGLVLNIDPDPFHLYRSESHGNGNRKIVNPFSDRIDCVFATKVGYKNEPGFISGLVLSTR